MLVDHMWLGFLLYMKVLLVLGKSYMISKDRSHIPKHIRFKCWHERTNCILCQFVLVGNVRRPNSQRREFSVGALCCVGLSAGEWGRYLEVGQAVSCLFLMRSCWFWRCLVCYNIGGYGLFVWAVPRSMDHLTLSPVTGSVIDQWPSSTCFVSQVQSLTHLQLKAFR